MSAAGGLKKAWRDSACLMVATGPFRYNGQNAAARLTSAGSFLGPRSAPPICLEATEEEGKRENMEFLFVQRNKNAGFMVIYSMTLTVVLSSPLIRITPVDE